MALNLLAYSAYRPRYQLPRAAISAALTGESRGSGSRAVAGYDEDAISMAVAATRGLGTDLAEVDNLFLGTSESPFLDKSSSLVVHAACNLHDRAFATDLVGLRSGIGALRVASTAGGVAVMADMRTGRPGSAEEADGGDGAAAFLFGESAHPVAEVLGHASVPVEMMDVWRPPGSTFAQTGEDRFLAHALGKAVREVVIEISKRSGHTDAPTTTVVSTLNRRLARQLAESVDSERGTDVQELHRERTGYCGAADVGLLLAAALDTARTGDTILAISAGGGADALLLRALHDGPHAGTTPVMPSGREILYHQFLTWRGAVDREPSRRPPRAGVAAPPALRDGGWKFSLVGSQCAECSKVYLPPERTCQCGATDLMAPFPLAGRRGTIVGHAADALSDSPNPPSMAALVDFGDTGRLLLELTDATSEEVVDGAPVDMVFRRTYAVDGVPNYFWKAQLVPGSNL
jgi:3-hydroxy-3-methylglutaryl CoA synthase/uncharacterized OB-fold protein